MSMEMPIARAAGNGINPEVMEDLPAPAANVELSEPALDLASRLIDLVPNLFGWRSGQFERRDTTGELLSIKADDISAQPLRLNKSCPASHEGIEYTFPREWEVRRRTVGRRERL
jgi:hypothetical protein